MAQPNIADLKKPWDGRVRKDMQVTGAIELAYLRGEQAGRDDGWNDAVATCLRLMAKWFFMSNKDAKACVTEMRALYVDNK